MTTVPNSITPCSTAPIRYEAPCDICGQPAPWRSLMHMLKPAGTTVVVAVCDHPHHYTPHARTDIAAMLEAA